MCWQELINQIEEYLQRRHRDNYLVHILLLDWSFIPNTIHPPRTHSYGEGFSCGDEISWVIQRDSLFAGHSLGEYSALVGLTEVMPIEPLVSGVFCPCLTMQAAVERDAEG